MKSVVLLRGVPEAGDSAGKGKPVRHKETHGEEAYCDVVFTSFHNKLVNIHY